MKNHKFEVLPAWYELSWRTPATIVIRVHESVFGELTKIPWDNTPFVTGYKKAFGFDEFAPPHDGEWGFLNTIKRANSAEAGWIVWKIKLPILKHGHRKQTPQKQVWALRATLAILAQLFLDEYVGTTENDRKQLIVLDYLAVEADLHGGSLAATLTPAMCKWLQSKPGNHDLDPVSEVMKEAYFHMWPDRENNIWLPSDFRVTRGDEPLWIHLTVPGNACGLDPDYCDDDEHDAGYTLTPHNVDSSLQQFTFLAGLARLHDLAREA